MKFRTTLMAATIMIGLSGAAFAWEPGTNIGIGNIQNTDSSGNPITSNNFNTAKGGTSTSQQHQRQSQTQSAKGGRGGNSNVTVNNGSLTKEGSGVRDTQIPVSSAIAPNIYGGANPCSGSGLSFAGSFVPFSGSLGSTQMDPVCQAVVYLHDIEAAKEIMCRKDKDFRNAVAALGRPCLMDVKHTTDQQTVVPVTPTLQPRPGAPEWCNRVNLQAMNKECL